MAVLFGLRSPDAADSAGGVGAEQPATIIGNYTVIVTATVLRTGRLAGACAAATDAAATAARSVRQVMAVRAHLSCQWMNAFENQGEANNSCNYKIFFINFYK